MNAPPLVHCIETTEDTSREKYWIDFFRKSGARLTNLTDGGEGISGYRHTEETKKKISLLHKGTTRSEATRKLMGDAASERWRDGEYRKRMIDQLVGHPVSEETRVKISNSRKAMKEAGWVHPCTGKKHSEERVRKNSESQKKRYLNGAVSHRLGVKASEETKAKLRAALQRRKDRGEPLVFKSK